MIESMDIIVSILSSVPLFHWMNKIMKIDTVPMFEKKAEPRAEMTFILKMTPSY